MRASVSLLALLAGCPGCFSTRGCTASCAVPDASAPDAGLAACDRPTAADPSAVLDVASFRAQASAAVCDASLRCGWGVIGDSFCHPAFAARVGTDGTIDLAAARSCVAQLATSIDCEDALAIAWDCYAVNTGASPTPGEGDACTPPAADCSGASCRVCSFGLACVAGACVRTAPLGAACDASHPCSVGAGCRERICSTAPLGADCSMLPCAPGLVCSACWFGSPAAFCNVDGRAPPPRHHPGCPCAADSDCPTDVAVCSGGVCALRPFVGAACAPGGPPCFGSRCDDTGTCVPFGLGEGPCGVDNDCASGLVCARPAGTCMPPLRLGDACGPGVVGACRDSCCDGRACALHAERGGSCAECRCATGLTCSVTSASSAPSCE